MSPGRLAAEEKDQHAEDMIVLGIGIATERLPVIFEMFRQGDSSDSRSYSGVGLGLYIVQRLLDQLGGDIAVVSAPGRGTIFTVTLPVRAAPSLSATA
jgi:signal transduction histidine kinase